MGERDVRNVEVVGSIPMRSTKSPFPIPTPEVHGLGIHVVEDAVDHAGVHQQAFDFCAFERTALVRRTAVDPELILWMETDVWPEDARAGELSAAPAAKPRKVRRCIFITSPTSIVDRRPPAFNGWKGARSSTRPVLRGKLRPSPNRRSVGPRCAIRRCIVPAVDLRLPFQARS